MTNQIVVCGDNIEVLKTYPDNYFDAVVTDPPYGLGKEPNAEEVMKGWIEKGYHEVGGSGFMGKEWDAFIPQPIFWKEVFRVLKHGGHVLSFFGTRTYDWGVMSMRFAGFEIRDCIQWLYGSGFPKSHNISKAIDKLHGAEREVIGEKIRLGDKKSYSYKETEDYVTMGKQYSQRLETKASTEEAKQWEGFGSALKPSNEPIVLARKPLEKGLSIAENVLKWGVGGININGCRIEGEKRNPMFTNPNSNGMWGKTSQQTDWDSSSGRFPANLILTHHPECECKGLKKIKAIKGGSGIATMNSGMGKNGIYGAYSHEKLGENAGGLGDENGEEIIEHWECHPDCPIKIMDEQSGAGASRFFYCAKASKSERNNGLEGFEEKQASSMSGRRDAHDMSTYKTDNDVTGRFVTIKQNFHPTVKPVKLMQYLARLITPPNGKVLDPFCGSGTTGIACKLEEFEFVGIEQDAEYTQIAQARIENYQEEPLEPLEIIQEDSLGKTITQTSLF